MTKQMVVTSNWRERGRESRRHLVWTIDFHGDKGGVDLMSCLPPVKMVLLLWVGRYHHQREVDQKVVTITLPMLTKIMLLATNAS